MKGSSLIELREATQEDILALCGLLKTLFSGEREFIPNADVQKCALEMILGNPEIGKIFVCQNDGEIIGMVSLLFTISTALGGKVAMLEDMIVSPQFQGKGFGTKLLAHAIAEAKKLTCKRLTLLSDTDNLNAHRFYEQFGFKYSPMLPMRLILEDAFR